MSLDSKQLAPCLRSGKVFLAANVDGGEPLVSFLAHLVDRCALTQILHQCLKLHPDVSATGDLVDYIQQCLDADVADIFVYCIFSCNEQFDFEVVPKYLSVPKEHLFVLSSLQDRAIILANRHEITISDVQPAAVTSPKDTQKPIGTTVSYSMQHILRSRKGYHTDGVRIVRKFSEVLDYETLELHNTDIYQYLAEHYKPIADLEIPYDTNIPIDAALCKYFNSKIIKILSSSFCCDFGDMACCWVCADEEAVDQYYIQPFKNFSVKTLEVCFTGDMYPLADLGASGCLIAAENINLFAISTEDKNTSTCEEKTSVFTDAQDRGEVHTVLGVPSFENAGFVFAVTKESFKNLYGDSPSQADVSHRYQDLYLTTIVPRVAIWDTIVSKNLLKVTFDDYGIQSIEPTDVQAIKYSKD